MNEMIQELVNSRGVPVRVDRALGVIHGVKILGLESRNGRTYSPQAVTEAARLYEEAKVNVNHPKGGPSAPRDYQDRIGTIRNVVATEGEGLFGDFHFNPKHVLAEQLVWDAENAAENVGFSHNVEARTTRRDGRVVVEAILGVRSVDLVADPATTRGLFESSDPSTERPDADPLLRPADLTIAELSRSRPDLLEEIRLGERAEREALIEELERLRAAGASKEKEEQLRRLLREHDLPEPDGTDPFDRWAVSPRFVALALEVPSERTMREMIAERALFVRAVRDTAVVPRSRDQGRVDGRPVDDARSFVRSIT